TNPTAATLAGTTSVTPSSGVATFTDITLDKSGQGFTLVASLGGFHATSTTFDVSGPPAKLVFLQQPTNVTAGSSSPTSGLYRWWKLDDNSGSTAADATGGANATLANGPT